jgi:hypothetical protein
MIIKASNNITWWSYSKEPKHVPKKKLKNHNFKFDFSKMRNSIVWYLYMLIPPKEYEFASRSQKPKSRKCNTTKQANLATTLVSTLKHT